MDLYFQNLNKRSCLVDNDLYRLRQCAAQTIGSHHDNARDVEALATSERAHQVALVLGEVGTVRIFGAGIAHSIKEDGLETQDAERYVEQTIVDGGTDTGCAYDGTFGEAAALEAVVTQCDIGRWVGQFAYFKGVSAHFCVFPLTSPLTVKVTLLPTAAGRAV